MGQWWYRSAGRSNRIVRLEALPQISVQSLPESYPFRHLRNTQAQLERVHHHHYTVELVVVLVRDGLRRPHRDFLVSGREACRRLGDDGGRVRYLAILVPLLVTKDCVLE